MLNTAGPGRGATIVLRVLGLLFVSVVSTELGCWRAAQRIDVATSVFGFLFLCLLSAAAIRQVRRPSACASGEPEEACRATSTPASPCRMPVQLHDCVHAPPREQRAARHLADRVVVGGERGVRDAV